jgi:alanine racemase
MLYGASPSGVINDLFPRPLRAAMTLFSEIIAIQNLAAGASVGYGSQFTATQPMRIGIVACGYADGYPRHAATGTPILVEGIRTCTLGRVSMDMLCVDLSPIPQAHIGSPVELWGQQLPIDDVAQSCATVGYELMCAVAPRVPTIVD